MESILRQLAEATSVGNRELVETLVGTLLDVHAEDSMAHLTAAQVYFWLGQKDRCYMHAAVAIALDPHTPAPYTLVAQVASKSISRRTLQRILENGWESANQPFAEQVSESRRRQRRQRRHRQEIEVHVRDFNSKFEPPVA